MWCAVAIKTIVVAKYHCRRGDKFNHHAECWQRDIDVLSRLRPSLARTRSEAADANY